MKQVRIAKDGSYNGVHYKIGEIWNVIASGKYHCDIEKDGKKTHISISADTRYGIEGIEITEQQPLPIFN
jgi:hypothetical protein